MSNVSQIAGGIAGAAIGFFVGGPMGAVYGASIGFGAASLLDMGQQVGGPKLEELKIQRSSYGDTLKVVLGNARVAGSLMWIGKVFYRERDVGGKGGGGASVYDFSATFAIAIAEGPYIGDVGQGYTVGKIWADTEVIYDGTATNPYKDGIIVVNENSTSASGPGTIRIFQGKSDQPVCNLIASFEGATPAYRNTVYAVFDQFDLAPYGNRIPNFTFSVGTIQDPTTTTETTYEYAVRDSVFPDLNPNDTTSMWVNTGTNARADGMAEAIQSQIVTDGNGRSSLWANPLGYTLEEGFAVASGAPNGYSIAPSSKIGPEPSETIKGHPDYPEGFDTWAAPSRVRYWFSAIKPTAYAHYLHSQTYLPPIYTVNSLCALLFGVSKSDAIWFGEDTGSGYVPMVMWRQDQNPDGTYDYAYAEGGWANCPLNASGELVTNGAGIDSYFQAARIDCRKLSYQCGFEPPNLQATAAGRECTEVRRVVGLAVAGSYKAVYWPESGSYETKLGLGKVLHSSDADYSNQTFWEDQLQTLIDNNEGPSDINTWVYGVDYPNVRTITGSETLYEDMIWQIDTTTKDWCISPDKADEITVAEAIRRLMLRANVPITDYTVNEIGDDVPAISGYVVDRQMSVFEALEALLKVFCIDCYEDGYGLHFRSRGTVATDVIAKDTIGIKADDAPVIASLTQDWDLPKTLSLTYQDPDADFIENTQRRVFDTIYTSVEKTMKVPITMKNDRGAQAAEILLHSLWYERESISFSIVDATKITLNPTDVIQIGYDGWTYEVRLTGITYVLPNTLECEGVIQQKVRQEQDDDAAVVFSNPEVYVSDAEGEDTTTTPQPPISRGDTIGYYLNTPNSDTGAAYEDSAGFLVAGRGTGPDWTAGSIYYSLDGVSFTEAALVQPAVITGTITGLPVGNPYIVDYTHTLRVTLDDADDELTSCTMAQLLAGANGAFIGNQDFDWEVIQFLNATLVSAGVYDLTGLLRGRLGTEWAMSAFSTSADTFVLAETNGVFANVPHSNANINSFFRLKAVTEQQDISDVTEDTWQSTCVRLKPYAPTHIHANRNSAGDIIITWKRRDRHSGQMLWEPPVSESGTTYRIDVLGGLISPITFSATTETFTLTATQQIGLFGALQSSLDVEIHQRSAIVGAGYIGAATV